jgi:hypothetical protein
MAVPSARLDDSGSAPAQRADRAALRPPRVLDDGTKVYDAVLVSVGDELRYPWGTEVATREALADRAYQEGLKGLSVTMEHPGDGLLTPGKAPRNGKGRRVGTVVDVTLDDDGELVVSLSIPEPADQSAVEATHREVSEGYTPTLGEPDDAGRVPQVARRPNHVALVPAGRAPSARVRTDAEEAQAMDEIIKVLAELMAKMDGYEAKMDGYGAKLDAMMPPEPEEQADRADAAAEAARFDAAVQARVAEVAALHQTGRDLGIQTPDGIDVGAIRGAILAGLGLDAKRADDAGFFEAAVSVSRKHRTDAASVSATTTTPRHAV